MRVVESPHALLTLSQIQEQRRALDPNGLRYLISMRSFYILNQRASEPNTPSSGTNGLNPEIRLERRERLRYRDIIWGFHSESQDLLLSMSVSACGGRMCWPDARALGVFLWMRPGDAMVSPTFFFLLYQLTVGAAGTHGGCGAE